MDHIWCHTNHNVFRSVSKFEFFYDLFMITKKPYKSYMTLYDYRESDDPVWTQRKLFYIILYYIYRLNFCLNLAIWDLRLLHACSSLLREPWHHSSVRTVRHPVEHHFNWTDALCRSRVRMVQWGCYSPSLFPIQFPNFSRGPGRCSCCVWGTCWALGLSYYSPKI